MKWFKKFSPQIPLQLPSGRSLRFNNVDGQWGILLVSNAEVIAELAACVRNEIGGVVEISEAEYKELEQKKTTSGQPWREELSGKNMFTGRPRTSPPNEASVPVVATGERFPMTPPPPNRTPIEAKPAPEFRPNATPRNNQ